ncbi:hypothetical protein COOONC_08183 [Cooperia oncophora]
MNSRFALSSGDVIISGPADIYAEEASGITTIFRGFLGVVTNALVKVTCAPSCMPACAPSCVALQPMLPPPPPPMTPAPATPAPVASLQCAASCMPSCLPSCTQQVQTAQIAVPCGNPCYCQPGYVQCAETMCCIK